MNQCDMCGHKGPKVSIGDTCPKCGQLVGISVPDRNARGDVVEAYDVEATDDALSDAIGKIAERNYRTLMVRKRRAEREASIELPAAEPKVVEGDDGTQNISPGTPPNADPAAATDPSVQPQPGDADTQ